MTRMLWSAAAGVAVTATIGAGHALGDTGAPPEVSVVSPLLDTAESGANLGVPYVYNLGVTTAAAVLPNEGPGSEVSEQVYLLAELPQEALEAGREMSVEGIARAREAIAPLAVANPAINDGVDGAAGVLDLVAEAEPLVRPLDRTASELASLIRALKVDEG